MKKILALGVAGLLLMGFFTLFAARNINRLAQNFSAKAVDAIQGQTVAGITVVLLELPPPQVDMAKLTIAWPHLAAQVAMKQGHDLLAGKTITLRMNSPQITVEGLFPVSFLLTADAIAATTQSQEPADDQPILDGITSLSDGRLSLPVSLKLWPPGEIKPQAKKLAHDLKELLHSGSTTVPVSFSGTSSFSVSNEIVTTRLSMQKVNNSYRLTMDRESLRVISWIMAEKLTDPEVDFLSLNPIKAPRLLHIRNDAQESARRAHEEHAVIPEDAYRHVLWSYLLTQTYGEAFAQVVTDAHEQGKTDNSEAEHRMDYTNNAVGRKYAAQHYQRHELIDRLLNDPNVIREATANGTR